MDSADGGKCDITVLLDCSGSMSSIASDLVSGFTELVDSQRKGAGEAVLSLAYEAT